MDCLAAFIVQQFNGAEQRFQPSQHIRAGLDRGNHFSRMFPEYGLDGFDRGELRGRARGNT
jgi:hypothetical protein